MSGAVGVIVTVSPSGKRARARSPKGAVVGPELGVGPTIRSQPPPPQQSSFQLMVRYRTEKFSNFNALRPGAETPIAPGRGENWPFGERFGRSLRSRSPESISQTRRKPGVFQAVSPAESGSPQGRWRRIGNRERTVSGRRRSPPIPCGCNCTPWPTTWQTSSAPWRCQRR